ncbi:MAG: hypothetical protein JWP64_1018 [Pseudonocardia sp.]|jgi:hypothetical protein|nr:hypothetical protein [Pseudonocardia sp.]MDT7702113.1 hypothetical protein [Pseudonocardiales bacterium]
MIGRPRPDLAEAEGFEHFRQAGSTEKEDASQIHAAQLCVTRFPQPAPGNYRMFIQFQTNNTLHTASITVTAS